MSNRDQEKFEEVHQKLLEKYSYKDNSLFSKLLFFFVALLLLIAMFISFLDYSSEQVVSYIGKQNLIIIMLLFSVVLFITTVKDAKKGKVYSRYSTILKEQTPKLFYFQLTFLLFVEFSMICMFSYFLYIGDGEEENGHYEVISTK